MEGCTLCLSIGLHPLLLYTAPSGLGFFWWADVVLYRCVLYWISHRFAPCAIIYRLFRAEILRFGRCCLGLWRGITARNIYSWNLRRPPAPHLIISISIISQIIIIKLIIVQKKIGGNVKPRREAKSITINKNPTNPINPNSNNFLLYCRHL